MEAADDRMIPRILEHGLATQEEIDDAVEVRNHLAEMGMRPRGVAEVLFEKGIIEKDQLEDLQREARRMEGKEQIAGYRLEQKLGEGAMGSVYKARQLSLDRDVAIKILAPDLSDDEQYVQRFFTEAKAVARLNHTNIISGIDVGEAGGVRYLVMEYADGMTVASLLNRGGAMDEERALQIGAQIARALDHAHRNGLVHRDVKPDNIIITKDGVAKLCDLGLARLETHEGDEPARMGTAAYISPEQARGDANVSERCDLYSLGCTLFHMLSGRVPFEGGDAASVLAMHLTEPAPSVRSLDPTVSERTDLLVQTLMAKHPDDRVKSAMELVGDLDACLRELKAARGAPTGGPAATPARGPAAPTPSAKPSPPVTQAPVRRRRRRRM